MDILCACRLTKYGHTLWTHFGDILRGQTICGRTLWTYLVDRCSNIKHPKPEASRGIAHHEAGEVVGQLVDHVQYQIDELGTLVCGVVLVSFWGFWSSELFWSFCCIGL